MHQRGYIDDEIHHASTGKRTTYRELGVILDIAKKNPVSQR